MSYLENCIVVAPFQHMNIVCQYYQICVVILVILEIWLFFWRKKMWEFFLFAIRTCFTLGRVSALVVAKFQREKNLLHLGEFLSSSSSSYHLHSLLVFELIDYFSWCLEKGKTQLTKKNFKFSFVLILTEKWLRKALKSNVRSFTNM